VKRHTRRFRGNVHLPADSAGTSYHAAGSANSGCPGGAVFGSGGIAVVGIGEQAVERAGVGALDLDYLGAA
jgi:hypothetical protein